MDSAKVGERYMDDILRSIASNQVTSKLEEINKLHQNLTFTIETEQDGRLPFLDICIIHTGNKLQSTWYTKPTDTGLIMNYHAIAPRSYKRSVVQGFVHRIYRACSNWKLFDESLERAKLTLERNQYPREFSDPIIAATISKIICPEESPRQTDDKASAHAEKFPPMQMRLQYRGRITDNVVRRLKSCQIPIRTIITLRKLKTALPPLKPAVPKPMQSRVVYEITCPGCNSSYVGQTIRQLKARFAEHGNPTSPVGSHFSLCIGQRPIMDDVKVLATTSRGHTFLLTLEALYIQERQPNLNIKDEYISRALTLRI